MTKKEIIEEAILDYPTWRPRKVDKRRRSWKLIRKLGWTETQLIQARQKHLERLRRRWETKLEWKIGDSIEFLKEVKRCAFDINIKNAYYHAIGIDWRAFHRPTKNGIGWVVIAPDEPANNWYTEHPPLVRLLKKIYLKKE